ncbi:TetR/AcrR family transcriptional regulator [hot springs metagenome]|uniref:TetR/AcrR family transcriptional regulator n=1 Tax=hot springs metagenome TaxID=433727 RepID=A0A5J4L440_9ZZZZ
MKKGKRGLRLSRDLRRKQIVEAALTIIANKGVSSLTTASIARKVGISESNLYRHFNSKDEIFQDAVEKIREGLLQNINAVSAMTDADANERLRMLFVFHLDYIEKNKGIPRLIFSEEVHIGNRKLKDRLLSVINLYSAKLESFVKEGQEKGLIKKDIECHAISLMFIGMIQILTMKWSLSGFSFPLVDEGKKLWMNFEKCLMEK